MLKTPSILLSIFVLLCMNPSLQADPNQQARADPTIDPKLVAAGFLDAHPDLLYRSRGLDKYGEREYVEAFQQFERAALYGDKPSQAILGEMLWIGLGAPLDRPMAFAWMSLAAERGYRSFTAKRELYWSELDGGERDIAERHRDTLHAKYGDDSATPRLEAVMRRERSKMTGSRVGFSGNNVKIMVPGLGMVDGSQFYDKKYWDPKEYRRWQDDIWRDVRIGRVNVGEPEQVQSPDSSDLKHDQR